MATTEVDCDSDDGTKHCRMFGFVTAGEGEGERGRGTGEGEGHGINLLTLENVSGSWVGGGSTGSFISSQYARGTREFLSIHICTW